MFIIYCTGIPLSCSTPTPSVPKGVLNQMLFHTIDNLYLPCILIAGFVVIGVIVAVTAVALMILIVIISVTSRYLYVHYKKKINTHAFSNYKKHVGETELK